MKQQYGTLLFACLFVSWLCAIAGFIFLFGPHRSPHSDKQNKIGAILFFGGLILFAVSAVSVTFNRRSENILVEPIIVLKLALGNVERQIFAAYFVVAADNAALDRVFAALSPSSDNSVEPVK